MDIKQLNNNLIYTAYFFNLKLKLQKALFALLNLLLHDSLISI